MCRCYIRAKDFKRGVLLVWSLTGEGYPNSFPKQATGEAEGCQTSSLQMAQ